MDISDTDFVNSFLKAARDRKLSVIVIYAVQQGTKANLKLTSNVGPSMVDAVLQWLRKSTPPTETPPTPIEA